MVTVDRQPGMLGRHPERWWIDRLATCTDTEWDDVLDLFTQEAIGLCVGAARLALHRSRQPVDRFFDDTFELSMFELIALAEDLRGMDESKRPRSVWVALSRRTTFALSHFLTSESGLAPMSGMVRLLRERNRAARMASELASHLHREPTQDEVIAYSQRQRDDIAPTQGEPVGPRAFADYAAQPWHERSERAKPETVASSTPDPTIDRIDQIVVIEHLIRALPDQHRRVAVSWLGGPAWDWDRYANTATVQRETGIARAEVLLILDDIRERLKTALLATV